jgi:hypothetical protein
MWRWTEFSALATCAAFVVGLRWGPRGVAAGFSAATALLVLPCIWYGARTAGIRTGPVVWALGAPLISSAVCVAAVWAAGRLSAVSAMSLAGAIPLKVAVGVVAYLAASLVVQRRTLLGAAREVSTLLRGRAGG